VQDAPLTRRLLALVYEALLLAAILWCAGLVYTAIEARLIGVHARLPFQIYLVLVTGAYFVWQWTHGGQTLPMKTWRLRIVAKDEAPLDVTRACARYALALAGFCAAGLGFVWALVDRDRLFLHDRLAGTRIVRTDAISDAPATTSSSARRAGTPPSA
jgi:uncharacterized RDD family membrane protein YckC